MSVKLTKAQMALLHQVAGGGSPVAAHYEPAKALVARGLAEWREMRFGAHLVLTPNGRAVKAALRPDTTTTASKDPAP